MQRVYKENEWGKVSKRIVTKYKKADRKKKKKKISAWKSGLVRFFDPSRHRPRL